MVLSSAKAIKNRIKSIENTMQITRAMELVSSSKLQKARTFAENTSAVRSILTDAMHAAAEDYGAENSVFFTKQKSPKDVYIVVSGGRGLAGGFNNNLFRTVSAYSDKKDFTVIPIGKKAAEHYKTGKHYSAAGITNKKCHSNS